MDILDVLNDRGIEYKNTNNPAEILLNCSSGFHVDKSPSLSYNIESNIFNCWSCGFRGGPNKYLASIGVSVILDLDSKQPYRIQKLKQKIRDKIEIKTLELPEVRKELTESFKDIELTTLKEFNAFTTNELNMHNYICIPVYQNGKLRFIEGRLEKELTKQNKYSRKPAGAITSDCLFPLDKIKNTNYVILVEGIFDMLNMWQMGYTNTLCIFGSTNFGKTKVNILDKMGITRVDIMMDSDQAGKMAADKIATLLDAADISPRIITLPEGMDPGVLSIALAKKLLT